jgi:hypothetical protein
MQQADFTDSFIKGMLGWIRWIASSIADVFQTTGSHSGGMSSISWFAANWIKILIVLIIVGVLVDWAVWMARWRPYWVWFRKRRILLDSNVEDIDDDDLMLRYGDYAPARARRGGEMGYDEDEFDAPDEPEDGYDSLYDEADDEAGEDGYDGFGDEAYDEADAQVRVEADEDIAALYGRAEAERAYGRAYAVADAFEDEDAYEAEDAEAPEAPVRPPRIKRRRIFARPRKKAGPEEDPFSVEGDFFDDLGADPMEDIVSPRVRKTAERDAQDTSVYQRPKLLPGDEPGAVRGADEDEGWHSGYTQRSAERGRRRKQDARG